jgi:tetratricopeptide (TPR) repeat protein
MTLGRTVRVALFALVLEGTVVPPLPAEERTDYPAQARKRFEQGQQFEKNGQWQEAVAAYEDALRLGMKDFPRAHLYRARSYLKSKNYDVAIAQYTRFLETFGLEESCRY